MKKIFFMLLGFMLMLSLVFAAEGQGVYDSGTGIEDPGLKVETQGSGEGQNIQLQAGEHIGIDGQQMMIRQESNNQIRLEVGERYVKSSMIINQEMVNGQTRLTVQLSNGRNTEIKIMPDVASDVALQRLRLKTCTEESNCSIELKEVGAGENAKLAYEVQRERQSKVLGLFGAKMQVRAQVDAETGELLDVNKPWWAFLATEPAEE